MSDVARLDAIDRKLLVELQRDASLSHAALADRVGASTASCWRRIRALESVGVLRGPVRLVDPARVGRGVAVYCYIRLKNHAPEAGEEFEGFVNSRPEIIECCAMSGDWDYLLRIVVEGVDDYHVFLRKTVLRHPSVATASSQFALAQIKYTTAIPV